MACGPSTTTSPCPINCQLSPIKTTPCCWTSRWNLRVSMAAVVVIFVLFVIVSFNCVSRGDCFAGGGDVDDDDKDIQLQDGAAVDHQTMMTSTDMPAFNKTGFRSKHRKKLLLDERQQAEWALLARENVLKMRSDSIRCAIPRARVIKVQDVHPQASKRFVPSCIVLHRCDRESGCCDEVDNVCSVVQKQRVAAHFYVVSLGEHNGVTAVEVHGRLERLRFTNHTQCGCRRKRRHPQDSFGVDAGKSQPDDRPVTAGTTMPVARWSQVLCWMVVAVTMAVQV